MRLFQNSALYRGYLPRLRQITQGLTRFEDLKDAFLADRFGAPHFLLPVLTKSNNAFFTNCDDPVLQRAWARENGLAESTPLDEVLLAQIEHHRTEVFYNLDPIRHGSAFLKRLPGCVKRTIAWSAAPTGGADIAGHDLVVSNFPRILKKYNDEGMRTAYFFPAHDPELDALASNEDRPVDVLFVGSYSRHHRRRAALLEAIAEVAGEFTVEMHLERSRMNRLAESPLGAVLPLAAHRRPRAIRRVSSPSIFGRELYSALGRAKIVFNAAIDMAGTDRGNMRCFEAMGAGALLVSDAGQYPEGMIPNETILTYGSPGEALVRIRDALSRPDFARDIARAGHQTVSVRYSKARQMNCFADLVELAGR